MPQCTRGHLGSVLAIHSAWYPCTECPYLRQQRAGNTRPMILSAYLWVGLNLSCNQLLYGGWAFSYCAQVIFRLVIHSLLHRLQVSFHAKYFPYQARADGRQWRSQDNMHGRAHTGRLQDFLKLRKPGEGAGGWHSSCSRS